MSRLSNLGLCNRANGLVSGEDFVVDMMARKKIYLVFLANDASANTKKMINDKAKTYSVVVDQSFSSEELSKAIGKNNRMVVGITNSGFVKILKEKGDICGEKK